MIVAGDFVRTGGMDRANLALAERLAERGFPVHLVSHRVDNSLSRHEMVTVHEVPRPGGRHFPASFLLSRTARTIASRLENAVVVANGGNLAWQGLNWVHYLHAAWKGADGSALRRMKSGIQRRIERHRERQALRRARRVVCNSEQTARQVIDLIGVPADRVSVVYYGADSTRFGPVTTAERQRMRSTLSIGPSQPCIAFVGALGDGRKNFATLFEAWRRLGDDSDWRDAVLLVVGEGAQLPRWQARAEACGLKDGIRFLGFRKDVGEILSACDLVVHPARYEAFGLSPYEALCRGVPVLVSADAGVAELIPPELAGMTLRSPDDADELTTKLRDWRNRFGKADVALESLSARCRARSWTDMADEIISLGMEAVADSSRHGNTSKRALAVSG